MRLTRRLRKSPVVIRSEQGKEKVLRAKGNRLHGSHHLRYVQLSAHLRVRYSTGGVLYLFGSSLCLLCHTCGSLLLQVLLEGLAHSPGELTANYGEMKRIS